MEGLTDAPMRAVQGEIGAFSFAVSEFFRISTDVPSRAAFRRHIPELRNDCRTPCGPRDLLSPATDPTPGLRVQVQLLGGDSALMAESAAVACDAGAQAIDINFGCPAPTVNRHDGGATILKYPHRVREIVTAVRAAVPARIPVSAKLRLGWECMDDIYENAAMAAEGGASWIAIHGRTKMQRYNPPAHWEPIGKVREVLNIPVVANGDIWTLDDFHRCREVTSCRHFMLGRGAMANPFLSHQVAAELGLIPALSNLRREADSEWIPRLQRLVEYTETIHGRNVARLTICRLKQWLMLANRHGEFTSFDRVKRTETVEEMFAILHDTPSEASPSVIAAIVHAGERELAGANR